MEKITVSVVDAKKQFSEFINRSAFSKYRVIITKRNRPVAAIISMKDLQELEQAEKRKGLLSVIHKWKNFEEIQDTLDEAIKTRRGEGAGRDVSL